MFQERDGITGHRFFQSSCATENRGYGRTFSGFRVPKTFNVPDRDVARGGSHPHILHLSAFPQISSGIQPWEKIKNLWRRKCGRRAIFRNVEVRVEGRFVPFNPYFVCNTDIGSLCDDFYRKSYDFSIKNR